MVFHAWAGHACLFRESPLTMAQTAYSGGFISAAGIFLLSISFNKGRRVLSMVLLAGALCTLGGLLAGRYTAFYGETVLTEGQSGELGSLSYFSDTLYRGRFGSPGPLYIELRDVRPDISSEGDSLSGIRASFFLADASSRVSEILELSDRFPGHLAGLSLGRINRKFGYSLRFVLSDPKGKVLESNFVYMSLFPPGREDFFRLMSPHTFYVRYYPGGSDTHGAKGPGVAVRVARNKDIVANSTVALGQKVAFDNLAISFDEAREWVKLSVVRDPGLLLSVPGFVLFVSASVFGSLRHRKG